MQKLCNIGNEHDPNVSVEFSVGYKLFRLDLLVNN